MKNQMKQHKIKRSCCCLIKCINLNSIFRISCCILLLLFTSSSCRFFVVGDSSSSSSSSNQNGIDTMTADVPIEEIVEIDSSGNTIFQSTTTTTTFTKQQLQQQQSDDDDKNQILESCFSTLFVASAKNHHIFDSTTTTTTRMDNNSTGSSTSTSGNGSIKFAIHHNGDPEPCSTTLIPTSLLSMQQVLRSFIQLDNNNNNTIDEQQQQQPYHYTIDDCMNQHILQTKYQMDAFLTKFIADTLLLPVVETSTSNNKKDCSTTKVVDENHPEILDHDTTTTPDENTVVTAEGLYNYCDMGLKHTVIQKDHDQLLRIRTQDSVSSSSNNNQSEFQSLPCRWYTREGYMITSIEQLATISYQAQQQKCNSNTNEDDTTTGIVNSVGACDNVLHLYAVPAGRVFMFGPKYVNEVFTLSHVVDSIGQPLTLTVLSIQPRVFDIHHFFSLDESHLLIEKALNETSKTYQFHRSTTGTSSKGEVFSQRTSENAWDTNGITAKTIKRRCFEVLGFDTYEEEYADGLQILRYNLTTAYVPHMDYLEDQTNAEAYDYDTAGKGGNRFATILLYFNDLNDGAGGETVFPKAWPPHLPVEERITTDDMIQKLRASGEISMLKKGSWEEEMVANCRTKLAIKPYATRAVLFYSQYPNGVQDFSSLHGGCPVLNGTKFAANLWTWSGIRPEYKGAPLKRELLPHELSDEGNEEFVQVHALFRNKNHSPEYHHAQVYFEEDGYFGDLGIDDPPVSVNTYEGHVWNIKDKHTNEILKTFVITDEAEQEYIV